MLRRCLLSLLLLTPACTGGDGSATLVLYTSVTQDTVDAVVAGFEDAHPGTTVEVFRAPTGELNARIAADRREGEIGADVLWLTDPLSMQQYDAQGVLREAQPDADAVPAEYREERFWGTRILNLVVVRHRDAPALASWDDLIPAATAGGVAIPDPSFAGSAFAALAFFALDDAYGLDFLQRLHDAGATQVAAPGDVVTGVAEGQYAAGITLDFTARDAIEDGSPIEMVWPAPGAIALYSPIAVTGDSAAAEDFVSFVLGVEGQTAIAATGWEPVRADIPWESGGPQVTIEWDRAFDRQQELLDAFRDIFGG
ncbi:MAG TPA: extracellular solute-binding protein [Acidimicrobiia bacterium]|nr:extracellular solute-binding protein [Acidimicrobiia bacterium]